MIIIIYLLTAIGLSLGSSTHSHTNNTQNNTNNNRTTKITNNVEECGPCPVFASFYSGICLTTEEKKRKNHSQNAKSYGAGMLTVLFNRIGDVALLMAIA
jgi:hypothetical protein